MKGNIGRLLIEGGDSLLSTKAKDDRWPLKAMRHKMSNAIPKKNVDLQLCNGAPICLLAWQLNRKVQYLLR